MYARLFTLLGVSRSTERIVNNQRLRTIIATCFQEKARGWSCVAEFVIGYKARRKVGLPTAGARCHIVRVMRVMRVMRAGAHFFELVVDHSSVLIVPGNKYLAINFEGLE